MFGPLTPKHLSPPMVPGQDLDQLKYDVGELKDLLGRSANCETGCLFVGAAAGSWWVLSNFEISPFRSFPSQNLEILEVC